MPARRRYEFVARRSTARSCGRCGSRTATSACTSATALRPASSTRCRCCTRTACCSATTSSSPNGSGLRERLPRARQVRRLGRELGQRPACSPLSAAGAASTCTFQRVRHSGPGSNITTMTAEVREWSPESDAVAHHGRRLVLGAGVAGAAEDRLTTSAGSAARTCARSTRSRSRRRSRTRSAPASTSSPTASCGATTTSTTSSRACPASRSRSWPRSYYYDYYDAVVRAPLPARRRTREGLGLVADYLFTREQTDRPIKFSFTGPFSLANRIRNEALRRPDRPGPATRAAPQSRGARAGRGGRRAAADRRTVSGRLSGRGANWRCEAINIVVDGVDVELGAARLLRQPPRPPVVGRALRLSVPGDHGRAGRPARARVRAQGLRRPRAVQQVSPGVQARPGRDRREDEARWRRRSRSPRAIDRALAVLDPESIVVNPDCGLRHLPTNVARAKLHAMSAGAALVRSRLSNAAAARR